MRETQDGEIFLPFLFSPISGFFPGRFLLMFVISRLLIPILMRQMFAFFASFLCCPPLCCLLLFLPPEILLHQFFFSDPSRCGFHILFILLFHWFRYFSLFQFIEVFNPLIICPLESVAQ